LGALRRWPPGDVPGHPAHRSMLTVCPSFWFSTTSATAMCRRTPGSNRAPGTADRSRRVGDRLR